MANSPKTFREKHPDLCRRWDSLLAQAKAALSWICNWCREYHVAVIVAAATAFVLLFLVIIDKDVTAEAHWAVRYMHDHGSDVLMALIVAFLAVVIAIIDVLRRALTKHSAALQEHTDRLQESQHNLDTFASDVGGTVERMDESRSHIVSLSGFLAERCATWEAASDKIRPQAVATINEGLQKLARAWAQLICLDKVADEAVNKVTALRSRCWQSAFEAYAHEELEDLTAHANDAFGNGKRGLHRQGPMLATNYPTYLSFLESISRDFTVEAKKAGFTPCFLAIANTVPVEWAMLCERVGDDYYCAADPYLNKWRECCGTLARLPGVVLRRVYLCAENDELRSRYRVPRKSHLDEQLHFQAWTDERIVATKELGLPASTWAEITKEVGLESAPHIELQQDDTGFFISPTTKEEPPVGSTAGGVDYSLRSRQLKQLSVVDINGEPYDVTARRTVIDGDVHDSATNLKMPFAPPSDLLIIGLLTNNMADARTIRPIVPHVEPLLAVQCESATPLSRVSVLSFYRKPDVETHLMKWFGLVDEASLPILG